MVIGGVIGLIALVMGIVGIRRSKVSGAGRVMAISSVAISLISIVASVGATAIVVSAIQDGELDFDAVFDPGTDLVDFPPEDDVIEVACTDDGLALATITVENPTDVAQRYELTVLWDTDTGDELIEIVESDFVDPGEQADVRIFQRSNSALFESCSVAEVSRSSSPFG